MAVERMKSCEGVDELAKELGVTRRCLYKWRTKLEAVEPGEEAARPPRRAPPRIDDVQPAMELRAGVLDVFAGALFGGFGFGSGVGVRLEQVNRFDEIHGLAVLGRFAGGDVAAGLHGGDAPLQAAEPDFQVVADVEGRDAIVEALERQASVVEAGARRQDGLQLQCELFVLVLVRGELLGRCWALLDPVDRIEGLRRCARSSQEKAGCDDTNEYHFGFHFYPPLSAPAKAGFRS